MLKYIVPVVVSLGVLAVNSPADAASGGHSGGHGGHVGGGHVPVGGGAYHGHYGGHYGGYYPRGGAFFYGGFYPGLYDPWYGYGSTYGYGYGPRYSDYGYVAPPAIYATPYPAVTPLTQAPPVNQAAEIDILLPRADAKVWVDGNPMTGGTDMQRSFLSPALEPGYSYTYRVTAAWLDNGQEVRVERTVAVAPGRTSTVDFTKVNPTPKMPPAQD